MAPREPACTAWLGIGALRLCRHKFRGFVSDPLILTIAVKDSKTACYVEQAIPRREQKAFVFELAEDQSVRAALHGTVSMHGSQLFLEEVRERQNLRVNCVLAPPELHPLPPLNMKDVRIRP